MDAIVKPRRLKGIINAVPSKSLSHRALIAAACAPGKSTVHNLLDSDDIVATKNGLMALGATIIESTVHGGLQAHGDITIDANESGSTLRFLIPLALTTHARVTFTGQGRLPKRPLTPYLDTFKDKLQCTMLSKQPLPLQCVGPLQAGHYKLVGNISSQFVSGLLFALPLLEGDSIIQLTTPLESSSYITLTLDVLETFGIFIQTTKDGYAVRGNQRYIPHETTIEGDFSQAAFFIVAGLLDGSITLKGLRLDSKQGDRAIIDIVKRMGAIITCDTKNATVTAKTHHRHATTIDLADIPDLGPILMVAAAASEGTTVMHNVARLRYKESDRLAVMCDIVKQLGAQVNLEDNRVKIQGVSQFKGNQTFDSHGDHRIAMALAIAALYAAQPITIKNAACIKKSYPTFFDDYRLLGGHVTFNQERDETS